jgi:hypothetical protein
VESVDLCGRGLTCADAVSLACALRFNTSLARLDLRCAHAISTSNRIAPTCP